MLQKTGLSVWEMIRNILFDFDGVILESNHVKVDGFYRLFQEFGESKARLGANYFASNAGLSRYDVIAYFFLRILEKKLDDSTVMEYAKKYSDIVKDEVVKTKFVDGCEEFLLQNTRCDLFVVSSSDENDLKYICETLDISRYFKDILGSPTKKAVNIKEIIKKYNLCKNETIYVGDSLNDYYATLENDLYFVGRNSGVYDFSGLKNIGVIKDMKEINTIIKGR